MQQLEDAVVAAYRKLANEGKIEGMIEKAIEETVQRIITDVLRSYSAFGKALEEKITSELNVDLRKLSFEGYNDVVLKLVKKKFDNLADESMRKQMDEFLGKLLEEPPKTIKLSELMKDLVDGHTEESYENRWEWPTLIIENDGRFAHVYIDKQPDREKYQCDYRIMIYDGRVSNVAIDGRNAEKTTFIGRFYGFEQKLFQLYAAKTNIDIDIDDGEIGYPYPD